jgi:regulator of sigma E protease
MAIISAGVIMNVIFAVLMASLAYGLGVKEMTCTISGVRTGGAAWRAGLRTGDEIVKIGDRENPIFNDLRHGVTVGDLAKGIEFTVRRPADGSTRTVLLKPDTDLGVPTIGVTSPISLTLPAEFGKGLPGAAGLAKPALEPGDTVRTIDGVAVKTYAELLAVLSRTPSATLTLGVDRAVKGAAKPERVEIALPPQPRRTTGITIGPARVTAVQEGSPAAAAGLEAGDTILAVAGEPAGDPLTLEDRLAAFTGKPLALTVGREGQADREVTITPREVTWRDDETSGPGCRVAVSALGIALAVADVVTEVAAGSPAAVAGMVAGDRLTRANLVLPGEPADDEGVPISANDPNWPAVVAAIQQLPVGTKLKLEVAAAAGQTRSVELEPVETDDLFSVGRGLVFDPVYEKVQARSLGEAFSRGFRKAGEDLSLVYSFLGKLWSNKISPRLLGGPIEIAKQAGKSAEEGFGRLLLFLTMLSANLAVVNFLPIPVLDGGHMVFLLYEFVRGKPPSETVVGVLSYLGLALILTLMMFVFGLDLGLIPRR